MNQTVSLRRQAKVEARARLLERMPQCLLAMLIYLLPLMALSVITSPGENDSEYRILALTALSVVGEIVLFGPLSYGLMRFLLARSRGGDAGLPTLFAPYGDLRAAWRGVRMVLCLLMRTFLWMLLPTALYLGGVYLTSPYFDLSAPETFYTYLFVATGLFMLLCLPAYAKAARYLAGCVVLCDDADIGVWRATKIAAQRFRGQFGEMVRLVVSFIPWVLLSLISYGAAMLVGGPYFIMTVFRMYDRLCAPQHAPEEPSAPEQGM